MTAAASAPAALVDQLKGGLDAPICLTWELTYACNLECVHCLSSSGRRDPRELTHRRGEGRARRTARPPGLLHQHRRRRADDPPRLLRARRVLDRRRGSASSSRRTVRSSTPPRLVGWQRWTTSTSRSASTAPTRSPTTPCAAPGRTPRRSPRWSTSATPASENSRSRSSSPATTSISSTSSRHSPTTTAPSCESPACARRGVAPTRGTTCTPRRRSSARSTSGCSLTATTCSPAIRSSTSTRLGDEFGPAPRPGLNLCGAGRVVCLIDPVGDVYACPFVIHDEFKAGSVRDPGGFARIWTAERAVH